MKRFILWSLAALLTTGAYAKGGEKGDEKSDDKKSAKLVSTINGRVYFDGTGFFKNHTDIGSGVTISDLRIGIAGKYGNFSGKVDLGFAKKAVSLKDVYLQYNFNKPNSYTRIGHFAEPFGLDYMESSGNIRFINAGSVTEAFAPGRKIGLEYVGWSKKFWFGGGFFGDSHFDQRISYVGNDGYALTGRLVYNPKREEGHILHVGLAGTYRKPDNTKTAEEKRSVNYGANLGSMINSQKFVDATIPDASHTYKLAGEFVAAVSRVAFQGEYFYANTSRHQGLGAYQAWGAYGQMGVLALGDRHYNYSDQWARLGIPNPGTLEFAVRYSYLDLNDADVGILGGKQQQASFACNFYWTKFLRLRLNYNFVRADKLNNGGIENFNFVSGRIQLFFN